MCCYGFYNNGIIALKACYNYIALVSDKTGTGHRLF